VKHLGESGLRLKVVHWNGFERHVCHGPLLAVGHGDGGLHARGDDRRPDDRGRRRLERVDGVGVEMIVVIVGHENQRRRFEPGEPIELSACHRKHRNGILRAHAERQNRQLSRRRRLEGHRRAGREARRIHQDDVRAVLDLEGPMRDGNNRERTVGRRQHVGRRSLRVERDTHEGGAETDNRTAQDHGPNTLRLTGRMSARPRLGPARFRA
jgi:hypothetical protein